MCFIHTYTYIHKLVILLLKGISDKIHFTIDIKAERLSIFLTHNANFLLWREFVTGELLECDASQVHGFFIALALGVELVFCLGIFS